MASSARALFALVALVAIATCIGVAGIARAEAPMSVDEAMARWASVLERFVDARGRVDFRGLADDRDDLDAFVAWVGATGPQTHPQRFPTRAHVIAYHVNAYNALAMHGVVEEGLPASLGGLRKITFFALRKVRVDGRRISLYGYENDVIRPLGEPRVHFALNCMAVSCPRLPREPFRGDRLDAQLERETRRFFAEERNLRVHHERKVVRLNEILDFYTEDFLAESPSLIHYVNRYVEPPVPTGYEVRFFDYDWDVNFQAAAAG